MLISKENRNKIYQHLFQNGVLVAKKNYNQPKHEDIDVPNLEVIKAMQSLNSRGYVKTQFAWAHYYYTLTDEGIEYLRGFLHLANEVVPRTFIKTTKTATGRPGREDRPEGAQDGEYRRRDAGEKKEEASGDFKPEFVQYSNSAWWFGSWRPKIINCYSVIDLINLLVILRLINLASFPPSLDFPQYQIHYVPIR